MSERRPGMEAVLMKFGARPVQESEHVLGEQLETDLVEFVTINDDPRVRELHVKLMAGEIGREEFLEGVKRVLGDLGRR